LGLRDVLRARLAMRIYFVGLAQFIVVVVGFGVIIATNIDDDGGPHEAEVRFVARMVESAIAHPNLLPTILEQARDELRATITIFDPDGQTVATNALHGVPHCKPLATGEYPRPGTMGCRAVTIHFPDARLGRIEYVDTPMPPIGGPTVIGLVLVVVGISSWLLARSLTRPLVKLSMTARALGSGNLKARVGLESRDELGDVSRAFDEMAERVASLLRAERELLANVSHELRTPLSRIRMALALIADAEGDIAIAREMLGEIGADLDELERLIADVLTAARLDFEDAGVPSGIPPLRRQPVDLAALVRQAVSRFQMVHTVRDVDADIPGEMPTIDADPVLLRRVFDNLLENAHKYTENPVQPIQIVARCDKDIIVDIVDKGIGIAPEELPRVFRPFYRVDKSRTRATGGLGLGLPLAKRIVEAHGGTLELTSVLREGTRARVRLPRMLMEHSNMSG
jgi:two-component system, OmpR family, sensor kinase